MNWKAWCRHFEVSAERPEPEIARAAEIAEAWRAPLAASIAKFHLGESGEGRIAHEIDGVHWPGIDDDYRAALKLFVREEGRHARILGKMVRALDGALLSRNWTERSFKRARRLLGVRFKLLVLLAAEVIGIAFYGLISKRLPQGQLSRALAQICGDEQLHLAFHADFFRAVRAGFAFRVGWWCVGSAAALAVLLDHRATLLALGIPPAAARRAMAAQLRRAADRGFPPRGFHGVFDEPASMS